MIDIRERRLNERYYGKEIRPVTTVHCAVNITPAIQNDEVRRWVASIHSRAHCFNRMACEGKLSVRTYPFGFMTDGQFYVFDSGTMENIQPVVVEFVNALNACPVSAPNIKITIEVEVSVIKIYMAKEGRHVLFTELDTEPIEKPTRTIQSTLPSPMLN